jgi:hypothetical protein
MNGVTSEHLRLAGMALAHAVWSIEDGETLCTLAMLDDRGERFLSRYEADSIPESIEEGLADLKDRLVGEAVAALVYDGYQTGEDGVRSDALIVELLAATPPAENGTTAAQVGRLVQRYIPGKRSFLRRSRVKLTGKPLTFGDLPADATESVIEGALEHEKVRDLFLAA